ncbi:MAG: hypothetical protein ACR2GU_04340 [Rubrobacteraceae bacterium]
MIFISHNVYHAHPIGDRFTILDRGRSSGTFEKEEVSVEELEKLMAGGKELDELTAELQGSESSESEAPTARSNGRESNE